MFCRLSHQREPNEQSRNQASPFIPCVHPEVPKTWWLHSNQKWLDQWLSYLHTLINSRHNTIDISSSVQFNLRLSLNTHQKLLIHRLLRLGDHQNYLEERSWPYHLGCMGLVVVRVMAKLEENQWKLVVLLQLQREEAWLHDCSLGSLWCDNLQNM